MWKRRVEIAVLALLVVLASWDRPHVAVSVTAPDVDVAALMPGGADANVTAGLAGLSVAISLID